MKFTGFVAKMAGKKCHKNGKNKQTKEKFICEENIVFCGNANTGKSTVFNAVAGANAHIGNWLGVTVDVEVKSRIKNNVKYNYFDLPGTLSLTPTSPDEQAAVSFLEEHRDFTIVNVCDINNLKRNLFFTLELLEQGYKVCLLLNFSKKFYKRGGALNLNKLSSSLGVPVILFKGKKTQLVSGTSVHMASCADAYIRHKFVDKILNDAEYKPATKTYGTSKLDKVLLNKFFAIPCFFVCMALIFFLTFVLVPRVFEIPINALVSLLEKVSGSTFYNNVILESLKVILNFLPQIITILLCINVLENSGYISRLAFVFEDVFEGIGLNGKSIFPILMSLGCATVATPFCKGISDHNTRLKTASILSLFPCSAKLPIIVLLLNTISSRMLVFYVALIYALSICVALAFAALLNKKYKSKPSNLMLEFPALRVPKFSGMLKNIFDNLKGLLSRIFFVILVINIILYCLNALNIISALTIVPLALLSIFGFNADAVKALISGIVGKELIATSLAGVTLTQIFSSGTLILFLIFALFYTPCFSTTGLFIEQFGIKQTSKILGLQFLYSYAITCLFAMVLIPKSFLKFLIALTVIALIMLVIKLIKTFILKDKLHCNKKMCNKCKQNCCKHN